MSLLVDTIYNVVLERHADPIGIEFYGNTLVLGIPKLRYADAIGIKFYADALRGRFFKSGNGERIPIEGMTVREVVRHIGHSPEYRDRFITNQALDEALKLCYKHFLGRDRKDEDLKYISGIAQSQGFDVLIDLLIDSDEYMQTFGERVPPVRRT